MATLQSLALGLGLTAVVLFGAAAVLYYFWRRRTQQTDDSTEFFLTARHSVGMFTIAWSFYAGAMGSWALFSPPSYCLYAGILGLIFYSIASGFPIIVIGMLGGMVHKLVPNVISFSDFVHRRFGFVVSLYVAAVMLFNMGIALTAEFTAVGDLFEYVIGVSRIPVVVTIGVVSILYTAIGGLYVSIITDQWQAGCSVLFILILVIYVAVTFRQPLGPLPDYLQFNDYYGYAAIAVMPISLLSSTLFSEAMWQRCWATSTRKNLMWGSIMGAVMVTCAVFLLGFGGVLAAWSGLYNVDTDPANTILFLLFNGETWVLVIVTLLSVVMSESAVDSLQNAIIDTFATLFARCADAAVAASPGLAPSLGFVRDMNLWWIRGLVLALNVVPIIVSLKGFNVIQLFLMANLITTTSTVPIFCGLAQGPLSRVIVTPFSVMFGCAMGMSSLFWWTAIASNMNGTTYSDELYNTFFVAYDWPPFLIALGMSVAGLLLGALIELVVRRLVPAWREYPLYPLGKTDSDPTLETAKELSEAQDTEGAPLKDTPAYADGAPPAKEVDAAPAAEPVSAPPAQY